MIKCVINSNPIQSFWFHCNKFCVPPAVNKMAGFIFILNPVKSTFESIWIHSDQNMDACLIQKTCDGFIDSISSD